MKITSNINGNTKVTTYGNKFFYRESETDEFTQVKKAFYREGISSEYTQVYLYDNLPPVITITSSLDERASKTYTLTGTVIDEYSGVSSFKINDIDVPFDASTGVFSKEYTLQIGTNTFTLEAIDYAENIATKTISIVVKNDSGNPNADWSQWRDYYVYGSHTYQIYSNGGWVTVGNRQERDGESWVTAGTSCDNSIYLPKGIKTASIYVRSYASGTYSGGTASGSIRIIVTDTTTGTVLFDRTSDSGTGIRGVTASLSFTETNSLHNNLVRIIGNAYGREYGSAAAEVGINSSNSYSFTWW